MPEIYDETHNLFREAFRDFAAAEMVPHFEKWEKAGIMDREIYAKAGELGFVGFNLPESHGGGGSDDFRFNVIVNEELQYAGLGGAGNGITLVNDILAPYFIELSTAEQRDRWLPGLASGDLISAVAMTEPGTGSDLASIATRAVRDGDEYVVNGAKTFITNGINADLVVTVVRTDPDAGRHGLSLLVLERGMAGFDRGRNLDKIGQKSADTAELFFSDVRVPVSNLLGDEGRAMEYLTGNLPQERLSLAIGGVAVAQAALDWTVEYVKDRAAFGARIADFQNTKFVLAECESELAAARPYMADCVARHNDAAFTAADAAKAKLWATELQGRITDKCLQLFGGYGFMTEYPISLAYADARVARIYGGTSEIMKTIIAKDLLQ
ncbi:MAG: acyl-CoA dehydrogenase family protein [Acidimicrobiales bacterium]|nr:acyl-CoA dehydrogenase family protein [Acidimicrobiales bacterium]